MFFFFPRRISPQVILYSFFLNFTSGLDWGNSTQGISGRCKGIMTLCRRHANICFVCSSWRQLFVQCVVLCGTCVLERWITVCYYCLPATYCCWGLKWNVIFYVQILTIICGGVVCQNFIPDRKNSQFLHKVHAMLLLKRQNAFSFSSIVNFMTIAFEFLCIKGDVQIFAVFGIGMTAWIADISLCADNIEDIGFCCVITMLHYSLKDFVFMISFSWCCW